MFEALDLMTPVFNKIASYFKNIWDPGFTEHFYLKLKNIALDLMLLDTTSFLRRLYEQVTASSFVKSCFNIFIFEYILESKI